MVEIKKELYIDIERFEECLDDFKQMVSEHQKANKSVAFKSGFINEQEGYKRRVFNEAKELKPKKKGGFCNWIKGSMTSIKDNNLIDWRDREYLQKKFEMHPVESEELVYR